MITAHELFIICFAKRRSQQYNVDHAQLRRVGSYQIGCPRYHVIPALHNKTSEKMVQTNTPKYTEPLFETQHRVELAWC